MSESKTFSFLITPEQAEQIKTFLISGSFQPNQTDLTQLTQDYNDCEVQIREALTEICQLNQSLWSVKERLNNLRTQQDQIKQQMDEIRK